MRYYDIILTSPKSTGFIRRWTSHPSGQFNPAALNVEFDMPIAPYATPTGAMTVTIHGVPREDLSQAYKLAGMEIAVYGGMQKGLPLANPLQSGLLLRGQVFQAFGTWEGTEMRLDLVVYPSTHTVDNPGNFVLSWRAGTSLADALKATLSIVYPGVPIIMNIGSNLVFSSDEHNFCATLEELAQYVGKLTESEFQQRVDITIQSGAIVVYDTTYRPNPIQLGFTDIVGQPTWVRALTMQVMTVMRADLQVGSIITMPQELRNAPGFVNTSVSSALSTDGGALSSTGKDGVIFQGNLLVNAIRHIGNFRSSDSRDWVSVFNCVQGA